MYKVELKRNRELIGMFKNLKDLSNELGFKYGTLRNKKIGLDGVPYRSYFISKIEFGVNKSVFELNYFLESISFSPEEWDIVISRFKIKDIYHGYFNDLITLAKDVQFKTPNIEEILFHAKDSISIVPQSTKVLLYLIKDNKVVKILLSSDVLFDLRDLRGEYDKVYVLDKGIKYNASIYINSLIELKPKLNGYIPTRIDKISMYVLLNSDSPVKDVFKFIDKLKTA